MNIHLLFVIQWFSVIQLVDIHCAFAASLTAHIHNVWFNPPTDRQPSRSTWRSCFASFIFRARAPVCSYSPPPPQDEQKATGCHLSVLEKAALFAEIENERSSKSKASKITSTGQSQANCIISHCRPCTAQLE
ncbi:hypothetical protein T4C_5956 [Trichinella pseudospiralis]|uniref:Secreted protein n=1 Tax=Trichinella pseudospiralis TaxID=6337 RepID=A0A0V1JS61_TRIPS|nr:hypothetical protein T4C_5956 [Trichinella pseudospiralis]